MLSFLHQTERDISRTSRGFSRDRRQFMEDWFLALFKDTLVYAHLATTPKFQARWNAHDYTACYDQLFEAHINRVAALLRVSGNNVGARFVELSQDAEAVLPAVTKKSLENARKQLSRYLQSTVGKQSSEAYDGSMELKHSIIAYEWSMRTYATFSSDDPEPVGFFCYATQFIPIGDVCGLVHDAGTLRLKAGHSLENDLTRWHCAAFRHAMGNSSPEPLRVLLPFYRLYPALLQHAVNTLDMRALETLILNDIEEKVTLLLSYVSLNNLKTQLQMSQRLLNQGEQGAARAKLIYRAYAKYNETLPDFLQKNDQAWAIWQEVLREKIMPSSSTKYQSNR